jgi:hypothetical protein
MIILAAASGDSAVIVFMVIFMILAWADSVWNDVWDRLSNAMTVNQFMDEFELIRESPPLLTFEIECYHSGTHTEVIEQPIDPSKPDGPVYRQVSTVRGKIVTLQQSVKFGYQRWYDASTPPNLSTVHACHIKFDKELCFHDDETAKAYSTMLHGSRAAYQHYDTHMDFAEQYNIDGLKSQIIVLGDEDVRPQWINRWFYVAASALCLSSVYRLALRSLIDVHHVTLKKPITVTVIEASSETSQ